MANALTLIMHSNFVLSISTLEHKSPIKLGLHMALMFGGAAHIIIQFLSLFPLSLFSVSLSSLSHHFHLFGLPFIPLQTLYSCLLCLGGNYERRWAT